MYISRGQLNVFYDGEWKEAVAGQAVFFQPWKPHYAKNIGDCAAQIFAVWWS